MTAARHLTRLVTLVFTDLVNSVALRRTLGDQSATSLVQAHRQLVRRHLARYPGACEIETAGDSFLLLFERPSDAAAFALATQSETRALAARESVPLSMRVGIHVGEVVVEEHASGPKPTDLHGTQTDLCARVMGMAEGGQILLTRTVFESARHALKGAEIDGVAGLEWVNHGHYVLKGIDEPVEVFEVGEPGIAVLKAPEDSEKARRQLTGQGTARTRTSRVTLVRAIVAIVIILVLAVVAIMSRQLSVRRLDPNVIAIAPFTTLGEPLALWSEGMMDVLSRALDGVGELRAVSPTLVVRSWKGRADRTSVAEMARANGAGLAVFGQIIQAGADSVRATVTVFDVQGDSTLSSELVVHDAASRMDRVSDSIAVRVFNQIRRVRSIGAAPTTALGSRSLPAIKAFLRGEQVYRRNDVVAARSAFEEAVAADTTFALAYRRLRLVLRFFGPATTDMQRRYAHRAGALNHGLGRRDSLMILADSLIPDPLPDAFVDLDAMRRTRRRFAVLEQAAAEYPNDPEAWAELGAARGRNTRGATSPDSAFVTFERAIAADSLFAPPYQLAIPLALQTRGPDVALALARRFLVINPNDTVRATIAQILRTDGSDAALARATQTLTTDQLQAVAWLMSQWTDDGETGVRLYRILTAGPRPPFGFLGSVYRFRGHVHEASVLADQTQRYATGSAAELLFSSRYEPADAKALDSLSTVWLADETRSALPVVLARAADRHDPQWLTKVLSLAERRGTQSDSTAREWAYVAELARAYLALERGDSSAALQAFVGLPDSLAWGSSTAPAVMSAARLLTSRGRGRESLALLDRHGPKAFSINPWQVVWYLEVARAAASTPGQATRAKSSYARGAAAWLHADSALMEELKSCTADMRRFGVK